MQEEKQPVYACEDHIDIAIDEFIDKNETFPILTKAIEGSCSYCEKTAVYVLKMSE
ncbi:MAG: CxxH/CxxC protein [Clostridiaceae bacterium]